MLKEGVILSKQREQAKQAIKKMVDDCQLERLELFKSFDQLKRHFPKELIVLLHKQYKEEIKQFVHQPIKVKKLVVRLFSVYQVLKQHKKYYKETEKLAKEKNYLKSQLKNYKIEFQIKNNR